MRRLALAALALIALGGLALYVLGPEEQSEQLSLRVAVLPVIDAIPFLIAEKEGIFAKHGINASITVYSTARDRDAAIQAGQVDVALSDPVASLIMIERGVGVRIVSLLMGEHPEDGVFYLLASPGSQGMPKRIAISKNTIIEFVAVQMLRHLGIDLASVELVDVPPIPTRFQLLMEGKVEAAVLPDPWGTLAIEKGARLILADSQLPRPVTMSVVIAKEGLSPEAARRLERALNEALDLYKANPEKYRELIESKVFIPQELKGKWRPVWNGKIKEYPRENFDLVHSWLRESKLLGRELRYEEVVIRR